MPSTIPDEALLMVVVHYAVVALILAGGSALQSAAGFGYALFSVTLLLLMGMAPYEAIPIVTLATTVQTATGVWHHRQEVPWRLVAICAALVVLTVPIGVFLLGRITLLNPVQIRQVFGIVVLLMVAVFAICRPRPRDHVPTHWTVTAMFAGGVLGGLCGMAGPPIVLWAMSHQWTSQRTRATLWAIFLLKTPLLILFLYQRFGPAVLESALLAVAMIPAVLLGAIPGIWLGNRISKPALRRIAFVLIALLGLYMILGPLLQG